MRAAAGHGSQVPMAWTGVGELVVVLLPSWPLSLRPQHQMVWVCLAAQVSVVA